MNILTDYNITFGIKKIRNSNVKFMKSISHDLDSIMAEYRGINSCDNLLGAINCRIHPSQKGRIIYETQGLQTITIAYSKTRIYRDSKKFSAIPNIPPDYTLPTKDFREIVLAWRDFIASPIN